MSEKFYTEHTVNATCPYCGDEDWDSLEIDFGPGLEGEAEHTCGKCDKTFHVERHCEITYTTRAIEKEQP